MNKKLVSIAAVGILAGPVVAQAAVILSDDFESNSYGLNSVPNGWGVVGGTVDIVGPGPGGFGLACNSGSVCIDLDGSTSLAGTMQNQFNETVGETYSLSFWLSGNQRGGAADTVYVTVGFPGDVASLTVPDIASTAAFTMYTLNWTSIAGGTAFISFHNLGGDNIGAILDDVTLSSGGGTVPVPEPATLSLMGLGLAVVGLIRRKRAR